MKLKSIGKAIGIGAVIAGVGLFKLLSDNKNTKYSDRWFESASDDKLDMEREKVRQAYCSAGNDFSSAAKLQRLLWKFDDEIRTRKSRCHKDLEYVYPKHREHGWYLPNDD